MTAKPTTATCEVCAKPIENQDYYDLSRLRTHHALCKLHFLELKHAGRAEVAQRVGEAQAKLKNALGLSVFRGEWNTTTEYNVGDVVTYGAKTYVCTSAHAQAAAPLAFGEYWTCIDSIGDQMADDLAVVKCDSLGCEFQAIDIRYRDGVVVAKCTRCERRIRLNPSQITGMVATWATATVQDIMADPTGHDWGDVLTSRRKMLAEEIASLNDALKLTDAAITTLEAR